jgi:hypothetical protein
MTTTRSVRYMDVMSSTQIEYETYHCSMTRMYPPAHGFMEVHFGFTRRETYGTITTEQLRGWMEIYFNGFICDGDPELYDEWNYMDISNGQGNLKILLINPPCN